MSTMKNFTGRYHKTITALLLAGVLVVLQAPRSQAQFKDAGEIMRAGVGDANLLLENYLKPFGAGFGATMNTGWVNSARPYRPLGIDLKVSAAVAIVPENDQFFDLAQLNLSQSEVAGGSSTLTPTAFGEDIPGPRIRSKETIFGERLFEFQMPEGTGYPYVPAPMLQLTVGLIQDTDVSIRYLPPLDVEDRMEVHLWGIGAKHGLNQWLREDKKLPFDLSVQFGYSSLTAFTKYDVQPIVDSQTHVPEGYEPGATRWEGQGVELESTTFTSNLLIGKNFPVLSIFGGAGYQNSTMKLTTPGSYPVIEMNTDEQGNLSNFSQPKRVSSIQNPLDLDLSGGSGLRVLAGLRIRLGIFAVSATYVYARYPVANIGAGISFR